MRREREKRRRDRWSVEPGQQHARKRAQERAGVHLDREVMRDVWVQVDTGRAPLLDDQGGSRRVYLVRLGDARYPVVLNMTDRTFVTVLPGAYPLEDA